VLTISRNLLRRAHHTLRELGDDALTPAAWRPDHLPPAGVRVARRQR
jgi:hypothetical protein